MFDFATNNKLTESPNLISKNKSHHHVVTSLWNISWPFWGISETESRRKAFVALPKREGKLLDSLCFTDPTHGQDILHALSSKQALEPLLFEAW